MRFAGTRPTLTSTFEKKGEIPQPFVQLPRGGHSGDDISRPLETDILDLTTVEPEKQEGYRDDEDKLDTGRFHCVHQSHPHF
jgi:hypothetical protein